MKNLVTGFILVVVVLGVPAICSAVQPINVPEPATSLLIVAGSLGVAGFARFRSRSK